MASVNKKRRPLVLTQEKTNEPQNKRRAKSSTNDREQVETQNVPSNLFTNLLEQVGFKFDCKGNKIASESQVFKQKLTKVLIEKDIVSESLQDLVAAIDDIMKEENLFVASLFPSELEGSDEVDFSSQSNEILQDSLMKLLLGCDELQDSVMDLLIKKLALYTDKENVKVDLSPTVSGSVDVANIPRLILNHFRWLDFINESSSLAAKLLEMASVMQSGVACDIISFVPDLLTDECDHSTIASTLCDLLNNGPENITSAIFDALSNLELGSSVARDIQDLAISHLACGSVEDMPVIVKYLLKSCKSADIAKEVILELRHHLDFSVLLTSDEDSAMVRSSTNLIAEALFSSMQFHSTVASSWILVLDKVKQSDFHVGDVLCLFLLCFVHSPQQSKQAVSLLYSKIRNDQLPSDVVQKSFEQCSYLFHNHFKSVCKLAKNMVWNSNSSIRQMGALLYKMFLLHMDNFCKQEAIGYLVEHISGGSASNTLETDTALEVLNFVASTKPEVLNSYANYVRDALDRMDTMTLPQVRLSYGILTSLAYNVCNDSFTLGMRDEMHMILQKQLTHASDKYHHIGIIGCVSAMIAISRMGQAEDFNASKELSSLLQTMNYVLRRDHRGWAIFYDEIYLAFLTKTDGNCRSLAKKVSTDARIKLEKYFLANTGGENSSSSNQTHRLDTCMRYGQLQDDEQSQNDVAVRIASDQSLKQMSPLLCSLFCAIATLERRLSSSLEEIDALLCCPLNAYSSKYEDANTFQTLSTDQMTAVLDAVFATVNWFRELISVFASETDEDSRSSVLERLKQACELQITLERLLQHVPNGYVPPFMGSGKREAIAIAWRSAATGSDAKRPSKAAEQTLDGSGDGKKLLKEKQGSFAVTVTPAMLRPHLRELNVDVFALLKYGVRFEKESKDNTSTQERCILPSHLLYLLTDLKQKAKHRLVAHKLPPGFGHSKGGSKSNDIGFEKLDQLSTDDVAHRVVELTAYLQKHLTALGDKLKGDVVQDDDVSDDSMSSLNSGIFLKQHEEIAQCFESILEIFLCVLTWNTEHHGRSSESNQRVFLSTFSPSSDSSSSAETSTLLSQCFRYFLDFSTVLPSSTSACVFLKLLTLLHGLATDNTSQRAWMAKKVSGVADGFLKVDWNDCAGNPTKANPALQTFFSAHLKHSEDALDSMETFIKHALPDVLGDDADVDQPAEDQDPVKFPLLTRSNFYLFYKGMIEVLSTEASNIPSPSTSKSNLASVDNVELLLRWSEVVKVLELLIHILKSFSSRTTVAPALKHARSIVESFVRTGIPACEVTFREHQDDVINLLKKIQSSTRQLQHLTCHSKVSKDSSLTNHVPALKRSLETFVFRVKALMVLHNCHEAFWLGNLKNRNLQGEEILSQVPADPSSDEEEGDGEGASHAADKTTEQSYSESY